MIAEYKISGIQSNHFELLQPINIIFSKLDNMIIADFADGELIDCYAGFGYSVNEALIDFCKNVEKAVFNMFAGYYICNKRIADYIREFLAKFFDGKIKHNIELKQTRRLFCGLKNNNTIPPCNGYSINISFDQSGFEGLNLFGKLEMLINTCIQIAKVHYENHTKRRQWIGFEPDQCAMVYREV